MVCVSAVSLLLEKSSSSKWLLHVPPGERKGLGENIYTFKDGGPKKVFPSFFLCFSVKMYIFCNLNGIEGGNN